MSDPLLRLAVPSKGMEDDALSFLSSCGLRVNRSNPRQYRATMRSMGRVEVLFQRAPDIVEKVSEGSIDIGITGYDLVREHEREDDTVIMLHPKLGFGHCSLVLAVPEGWIDVSGVADLAEISADLRSRGRELRIATKYVNLTRQFLFDRGINYFSIVESSGALEAAPAMGYADMICDLTSSGVTLRENRLKPVNGGTILESQACMIANSAALRQADEKLQLTRQILELIEAHLRARSFYSLTANIHGNSPEAIAKVVTSHGEVAGLQGPTVAPVYSKVGGESGWYAATIVVEDKVLQKAVDALRKAGAADVTAIPLRYVFEHKAWTYEALRRQLFGEAEDDER
jgi:ATP phosphoribosyltransferase